jgi:colicin import membrane protein
MLTHPQTENKLFLNAFGIAVALHFILLVLFLISLTLHRDNFALTAGPQVMHATALFNTPMTQTSSNPAQTAKSTPLVQKKLIIHEKKIPLPKNNAPSITIKKQKAPEVKQTSASKPAVTTKTDGIKQASESKPVVTAKTDTLSVQKEASQQAQIMQGVVDKYKALILQSIGQNWIIPANADKHSSAELLLRLAPDGTVLSVKLLKSSGNSALDESAITAVQKASPLPVPSDLQQFKVFRQINLVVKPDIILV